MIPMAIDTSLLTGLSAAAGVAAGATVALASWRRGRTVLEDLREYAVAKSLALQASPRAGLDSSFILEALDSEESAGPLESAIATGDLAKVAETLSAADVYVLGQVVPQARTAEHPPQSEVLLLEALDREQKRLLLPVFTQPNVLRHALREHPDWRGQSVLELKGSDLLDARTGDVSLIINPSSRREFELPATPQ